MESLRGQLLVAGPTLLDPNFRRTVVLVCEHSEEGALGLVVNRATALEVAEAGPELADVLGGRAQTGGRRARNSSSGARPGSASSTSPPRRGSSSASASTLRRS